MKTKKVNIAEYEYRLSTKVKFWFDEEQSKKREPRRFCSDFVAYLAKNLLLFGTKGLLVVGSGQAVSPLDLSYLLTQFHTFGLDVVPVIGVKPGCRFTQIQSIAKSTVLSGISWVLAIGGGSVIDAGKMLSVYDGDTLLIADSSSIEEIQKKIDEALTLPIIAVPTCLGSGSEVSSLADIFFEKEKVKLPVVSDKLTPRLAIINIKLFQTVPHSVQASAIVDTFFHLIDPFLSAGKEFSMYEGITIELCSQLIDLSDRFARHTLTDRDLMQLAWISHLAVCPGLGRAPSDSILHRIEHAISPHLNISHGHGLALLFPEFIEEIRKQSNEDWRKAVNVFVRVFQEMAAPNLLFRRWIKNLSLNLSSVHLSETDISELCDRIMLHFGCDGIIPGPLHFNHTNIKSILMGFGNEEVVTDELKRGWNNRREVNEDRIFGQSIEGSWDWLVITPLDVIFENLCSKLSIVPKKEAWFPSACLETNSRCLILHACPGAISCIDGLAFARKAKARFRNVIFIGLAGSLRTDWPLGTQVLPTIVQRWESVSENVCKNSDQFIPDYPTDLKAFMEKRRGICSVTSGSIGTITYLTQETYELLDLWSQMSIDMIDLETSAIAAWCKSVNITFAPILIISDYPFDGKPLWNSSIRDREVTESLFDVINGLVNFFNSTN